MSFITPDDVRTHLAVSGASGGETSNDVLVQSYIDSAITVIEGLSTPITVQNRTVYRDGGDFSVTVPWPFASVVSIYENGNLLSNPSSDYTAFPDFGIIYRGIAPWYWPWYPGDKVIKVTVSVGTATPAANVRLATLELIRHLWQTRQGNRGSFSAPNGVDVTVSGIGFAVPNRVLELLRNSPPFPGFA